ncbi:intercellular adhesion molecule 4 isoform X2 [Octodon degus]|uniref:Intercellular adhesion molecule 4 isoform X2 n=1 Tax=Octodon degus TaxID=10160 RepID=A0A6P6ELM3_OCTDE|nr:intercellular adhesion molecule 4 isoform X2 [Octodon degus]
MWLTVVSRISFWVEGRRTRILCRGPWPFLGPLALSGAGLGRRSRGAPLSPEPARLPGARPPLGVPAMKSLLLPLPLLLAAAYPVGGSARRRQAELSQSPSPSPAAPLGVSEPFRVRLSPELVEVAPGHSVWLNCSTSCPLPARPSLFTQLRRGRTTSGPGWVSYELVNVTAWSSVVRCCATCAGERRQATARINAYSEGSGRAGPGGERGGGRRRLAAARGRPRPFLRGSPLALEPPRSVILEQPVLARGRYTLRCHVTQLFPVGFLRVSLRRGGRLIYFERLERFKGLDLANVTLTYTFRARPSDFWQPVTCHARLNLGGLVVRSSSAPVILSPLDWSPESKALASTSIATVVGILLAVGAATLHRWLGIQPRGACSAG